MSASTSSSEASMTSSTRSASVTSTTSSASSSSQSERTSTTTEDKDTETTSVEDDDDEDTESTTSSSTSSNRPSLSTASSTSKASSSSTITSGSDSETDSSSSQSSTKGPGRLSTTTNSTAMPQMSTLITKTTSSYSVTFTPTVPTSADPFIHRETALNGTVFIAVGSALVGVLFLYYLHRLYNYYTSKKNTDTGNLMEQLNTNYIFNKGKFNSGDSDDDMSTIFGNHSTLSLNKLANDATTRENHSIYSANLLNSRSSLVDLNDMVAQQGRSYKNSINKIGTTRASCYISPVGELVQPYSNNEFDSFTDFDSNAGSYSSMLPGNTSRQSVTPNISSNGSSKRDPSKKKRRPPSVLLDDLINQS
ncbi:Hypothetical protein PP7435_CHR3-0382 [Komagataella phaffii CBS 7435]|uniref:Uncharacterized protein n=2 Tax=Komagataella phaffii TaxID=460519 RepID=C4R5M3_KOMPG|nr:Hypothetical protein PAS_chr3_0806 [Komagataella phaffii GS115]AOA64119.1 GQ67_03911T0 [Komagataella phaffii]CAH2449339.1 Hypothetical protein BQ9382_C3-2080 [Komagataella phaffii CBS 7435]AOA69179.1 GQ68_03885T0 [Komagataella phaffii GS115]CAY70859.1 Hypothetical protein PAS_chr3_0806 [Komagataella phaffii GS115]CCA39348.1 Hypothetical protein PP7435_CHR3-0382 [Komagataella phaffii CBS 7435]